MSARTSLTALEQAAPFAARHIGVLAGADQQQMLDTIGYASMDALLADAIPASIREKTALAIPPAATEAEVAAELVALATSNRVLTSMIGLGYYGPTRDQPGSARGVAQLPNDGRGSHRAAGCRRFAAR
jgi:glycine dehydrogenase